MVGRPVAIAIDQARRLSAFRTVTVIVQVAFIAPLLVAAITAAADVVLIASLADWFTIGIAIRIMFMKAAAAHVASEGISLMLPARADTDAVLSQIPLITRLHVADEIAILAVEVAVNLYALFCIMPPAAIVLHTNRKRTGFPVLTKDFRLRICCGHTFSSSYLCIRFR
jgi:hypothetical protein